MFKRIGKKWKPNLSNIVTLDIRESVRPHRAFIDNEYMGRGYASFFPHSANTVYLILSKYANHKTQCCYPSAQTVMQEAGMSNRNTYFRDIELLKEYNIIQVVSGSKGRVPNVYQLMSYTVWKEINSDNFATVSERLKRAPNKETTISNKYTQQYQKEAINPDTSDTESHIHNSDEIFEITSNFQQKGRQTIERWSTATRSMVMRYFAESDVIEFLDKNPTIEANAILIINELALNGYKPHEEIPAWLYEKK